MFYIRIMGFDTSANNLGCSVIDVCIETGKVNVLDCFTLHGQKLAKRHPSMVESMGEKAAKLKAIEFELVKLFQRYDPTHVASEAPYMGRFPQAYASLIECQLAIRYAVWGWNPTRSLSTIEPSVIKVNMDVSGRSGDKDEMTEAIRKLIDKDMIDMGDIDLDTLDEHSVDSICIAITEYKRLAGEMKEYVKKPKSRKKKKSRKRKKKA